MRAFIKLNRFDKTTFLDLESFGKLAMDTFNVMDTSIL